MRTNQPGIVTDHDLIAEVSEDQHHGSVESYDIVVNSQALAASSSWEHREALSTSDHKSMYGVLRGKDTVGVQGHVGVFFLATDGSEEGSAIGFSPYGGTYFTSYMGGYSRMHGDTYMSRAHFGPSIVLKDAYIDGDEAVLEFYNASSITRNITVYGTVVVK